VSETLLVRKTRFAGDGGRVGEAKSRLENFRSFLLVERGLTISVGVRGWVSLGVEVVPKITIFYIMRKSQKGILRRWT